MAVASKAAFIAVLIGWNLPNALRAADPPTHDDTAALKAQVEKLNAQVAQLSRDVADLRATLAKSNADPKAEAKDRGEQFKNDPGASFEKFCGRFLTTIARRVPYETPAYYLRFEGAGAAPAMDLRKTDSVLTPYVGTLTASLKKTLVRKTDDKPDGEPSVGKWRFTFAAQGGKWVLKSVENLFDPLPGKLAAEWKDWGITEFDFAIEGMENP